MMHWNMKRLATASSLLLCLTACDTGRSLPEWVYAAAGGLLLGGAGLMLRKRRLQATVAAPLPEEKAPL